MPWLSNMANTNGVINDDLSVEEQERLNINDDLSVEE